jgi:cytochrome P450
LINFVPKSLKEKFASHDKLTRDKVQRRLERTVTYKDLTSELFNPRHKLQRYQIENNCSTIIIGGSETTATVLSAVTYYLTQNPGAKAKVIREIRGAFSSSKEINAVSTGKLKYLQACLTEALRKFPPAPGVFFRRVPKGGDFIANHWVLEGMQVGISIFCANNSKLNFKDPEIFAPERWTDDTVYWSDDRRAMQAFSYGLRNCIGHNLAKMEMRLVLARLIWEFDWEIATGSNDWDKTLIFQTWAKNHLRFFSSP